MSEETESKKKSNEPPFAAEYAKTGRASCKACKEPIPKDSLRMAVRTPSRFFDGLQDNWFHFNCFYKRAKSDILTEGNIRGMESLKWEDQEKIRARIAEVRESGTNTPAPKSHIPKVETAKSGSGKCFECKEKISKGDLRIQVKASNFHPQCLKTMGVITTGADSIQGYEFLDDEQKKALEDVFGKQAEKEAKRKADGDVEATPAKKAKTEVDDELKAKLKLQADTFWKIKKELNDNLDANEVDTILQANGRYRRKRDGPGGTIEQLADCIIFGVPDNCTQCNNGVLFYSSSQHTYKCSGNISEYTACTFTSKNPSRTPIKIPKDITENNDYLKELRKKKGEPLLTERFYSPGTDEVDAPLSTNPIDKIKRKRRGTEAETLANKKAVVKNGCSIDGNCEVAEIAHVYIDEDGTVYQATLGHTDIAENRNSFYKLQLLKHDKKKEYYLFRSWGRIGTTQGGFKTEFFDDDLDGCKHEFERLFLDKSKNSWENRHEFQKQPGGMNILEMELDGQESKKSHSFDIKNSKSTLPYSIKQLITDIFDVNLINETLKSMDIDLVKMPLGKISKKHIMKAMKVLKDLETVMKETATHEQILDCSNRFYTLIPHATGSEAPPLLDNDELIHSKTNLLNDLLDIEIAYSIIKQDSEEDTDSKDPIDIHYEKLHCSMEVVDRETDEYKLIEEYAKKTHAPTHNSYTLEVVDVFKISREGEEDRFKKDIGNRNLLWHGSRTSNFAGILSQGLRIAPPEAPVNGYMFGKGIYFADMVSKSANYCGVSMSDGEGLLLLCEVALGEIQEEKAAKESIKKPKKEKSSVKGLGQIVPDESTYKVIEDGIKVPMGKPTARKGDRNLALLYNEYIVYDESQVKMRYLIKTKFNMK